MIAWEVLFDCTRGFVAVALCPRASGLFFGASDGSVDAVQCQFLRSVNAILDVASNADFVILSLEMEVFQTQIID